MTDGNENLGENGLPMLSFPSMDDLESKSSVEHTNLGADKDVGAAVTKRMADAIGDTGEFFYNPDDSQEEMNRNHSMEKLKSLWGSSTDDHIEIARFALSYVDDDVILDLERSGLGSHHIMISSLYNAAKSLEKEAVAMYGDTSGITGKGMTSISMKKMGEKSREVLNRAIMDAQSKIIEKHGAVPRW